MHLQPLMMWVLKCGGLKPAWAFVAFLMPSVTWMTCAVCDPIGRRWRLSLLTVLVNYMLSRDKTFFLLLFRNGVDKYQFIIHIYYSVYVRSLKCPCSLMVWYYGNDWHSFIVMSSLLVRTEHIVGFGIIPTTVCWHTLPFKVIFNRAG